MDNSVYGKTMENLKNRVDARLVMNAEDYQIRVNKSSFVCQKMFDETFGSCLQD